MVIIVGGGISSFVRTVCFKRIQQQIVNRLRKQIFTSLLLDSHRSIEFFDSDRHVNEIVEPMPNPTTDTNGTTAQRVSTSTVLQTILTTDVDTVAKCLTTNITSLVRSFNSVLYSTVLMYKISPLMLGISASVVPLIGGTSLLLMKFTKSLTKLSQSMNEAASSFATERVQHIHTVKSHAREEDEVHTFCKLVDQSSQLSTRIAFSEGAFMGGIFALTSATLLSAFYVGGKAVSRGELKQGSLTSFVSYSFLLGLGTSGFFKALMSINQGMISAKRIYNVLYNFDGTGSTSASNKLKVDEKLPQPDYYKKDFKGHVELTNVSFAYANRPNDLVLEGCTLRIPPSTVVALVGKNGAGKTTVASLLSGLYPTMEGTVTLDGIPLQNIGRKDIAKLISVVPQQPVLFATSILENIRYSCPSASTEQIMKVVERVNATPFILDLGLDYHVGRDGCRLSGGQRQRIALARALLNQPVVLVLDEPTSQLDAEGESAIEDTVRACRDSGTSLLVITHHMKTLAVADIVAVLENGRVVESGAFEELKQNRGALVKLMPDLLD
jgi:ABC-type multidrug transport system fused ATPase/permease subunit